MPEDRTNNVGGDIFKRVITDLIVGILFVAFMSTHWIFILLFIAFICGNVYTIIYSAIKLNDFKPLIYFLITGWLTGDSSNGKH